MDGAHDATLEFSYADERRARIVAESVRVEVGEIDDARSAAAVEREGRVVSVRVDAADIVALRAGTNSWLRLVSVAETVAADAAERPSADRETDPHEGSREA
ncbi:KEOPS complex subunit Pcc1 [Halopelagius inordinatus]|uniref:KEOPS complex subunit Pcc1 n=1 Tax=Halopelagius inordinatus TaxID=553467 RepID=A0A1I2MGB0_9EURY|nr:KEOPS complex subunit Pcc1 [Halopelagius inordinatus]SFF90028.1 KEOPS complex subunit Pcc1 [Halopelagius inordinatus]